MHTPNRIIYSLIAMQVAALLCAQEPVRRGTNGDKPLWAQSTAVNEFGEYLIDGNVDSLAGFFNNPIDFKTLQPRLDSLAAALRGTPHQPCGQSFYYDDVPNKILASFYDLPVRYDVPYKTQAQLLFTFSATDMSAKALRVEIIPKHRFIGEDLPPAVPPPAPR